jgi:hypothetical protein
MGEVWLARDTGIHRLEPIEFSEEFALGFGVELVATS